MARMSWRTKAVLYLLLGLGSLSFLTPFVWMLSTSLKRPEQVSVFPPVWIPSPIMWENYSRALTQPAAPFGRFFLNSAVITLSVLFGGILSSSLVAYGFARCRFPGKDALFVVLLGTMMVPYIVTMIPTFLIFRWFGWVDTFLPLIVPSLCGSAFQIFLLRQFFLTIPAELVEAARLDGCSSLRIYWDVVMPLSKPVLATLAVFSFLWTWNDFLGPLIYINSVDKKTVALGLYSFQGLFSTQYHYLMAASVVALAPVLLVFFAAQRYFTQGIVMTGLKA